MNSLSEKSLVCLRVASLKNVSTAWRAAYDAACERWSEPSICAQFESLARRGYVEDSVLPISGALTEKGRWALAGEAARRSPRKITMPPEVLTPSGEPESRMAVSFCAIARKLRYASPDDADAALHLCQHMNDSGRSRRQESRSYSCPSCDGWHLTSKPERAQ